MDEPRTPTVMISQAAPWPRLTLVRLVFFFAVLFALFLNWQTIVMPLVREVPDASRMIVRVFAVVAFCALMLAGYAALVRWFERRPATELAWSTGAPWFGLGLGLGVVLFCAVYATLAVFGVVQWNGYAGFQGVTAALLGAMTAAVGEEILFRGVIFRLAEDALGTTVALIVSAVLFGLMHAFQPGANWVSLTAIALEAGVLLGAAYAVSRSLWLPIGLHLAWNFTEGGIFGAAVSGGASHGIFDVTLVGHDIWTGGQFGPEASVVAVVLCLGLAVALSIQSRRTQRWIPPRFKMRSTI